MNSMIRFVDLKTGNTFNGSSPYIFWFDGEQGINLFYSQPICFISEKPELDVKLNHNDVFKLIDISRLEHSDKCNIYDFNYTDIRSLIVEDENETLDVVHLVGHSYQNYYIYIMYVIGSTSYAGEYIEEFYIDGQTYKIGADFYNEDETLYVTLSNFGVNIPEMIQKALYGVDVHEDKIDNITINRKWKELLSNYWDMIANRGSYKSLYNSLKWFEYGDMIRLCELWKHNDKYEVRDIQEFLIGKYDESISNFAKTTYESLYLSLDEISKRNGQVLFDDEGNPKLKRITSKWSKEDLSLKMCMLGNFYETYFMPIHLDLIHSTIENLVYTNTFKYVSGGLVGRNDYVYNSRDFECNVKEGSVFRLSNVKCYVGENTLFRTDTENIKPVIVGVQKDIPQLNASNNNVLKNYLTQLYNDVGCIVDFNVVFPLSQNEKICKSTISFRTYKNGEPIVQTNTTKKELEKKTSFSILCPQEGDYEVNLMFESNMGQIFVKRIKFSVIDTEHTDIKIYKIKNNKIGSGRVINDYVFSRQTPNTPLYSTYKQYIPAKFVNPTQENPWSGVCLNHLIVLEGNATNNLYIQQNYHTSLKGQTKQYTICISKEFGFQMDKTQIQSYPIYKESYIFIPEFHHLEEIGLDKTGDEKLDYYTVTDTDALCVVPNIAFGKYISEYEWEFINMSSPIKKTIKPKGSISEPFISPDTKSYLEPGYYSVVFRYRLTNEDKINTITLDSAFLKR